jgi:hypothetical protein
MLHCDTCGSSFNAIRTSNLKECPRCAAKDGVHSPLRFKLFERAAPTAAEPTATDAKAA